MEADRLPTFLVIGAPKCGTTSLSKYLGAHPDVFVTSPKEPMFFTKQWDRGVEWYQSLFADAGSAVARGEGSVGYGTSTLHPEAPERIQSIVPDVKLVYVVREPVQRLQSHWAFTTARGREHRALEAAIREGSRYVKPSLYGSNMAVYLEHFPREQLLIICSDDLRTKRAATVGRVLEFIGVDPEQRIANLGQEFLRVETLRQPTPRTERVLRAAGRTPLHFLPSRFKHRLHSHFQRRVALPTLPPDVEAELWEIFTPDLQQLRSIVGPDFDLWGRA